MTHALVVEDDVDVREAVVEVLTDAGVVVDCAANGRIALDMLTGGLRPDVIVLDLMMPEMDGREFRERQLADAELRAIPVVVATADGRAPPDDLAVTAVLGKPFVVEALLSAIEDATRTSAK